MKVLLLASDGAFVTFGKTTTPTPRCAIPAQRGNPGRREFRLSHRSAVECESVTDEDPVWVYREEAVAK